MADSKEKAMKIMEKNDVGILATISDNKPVARYMSFHHEEMALYTVTDKRTEKVEDIEKNPNVFVLLGHDEGILDKDYVEIEGIVSTTENQGAIDKAWNDYMDEQYDNKEDPNILVLKIEPKKITVKNKKGDESEEVSI